MKQDNCRLVQSAQSGDRDALEKLVINNTGLIWSIAHKFSGRGTDNEDLFQIGAIGLIKAAEKFDSSFNVEFSTYAVPMIMGEIRRFLRDDGIIKVSRSIKETAGKAKAAAKIIESKKGSDATVTEIADMIGECTSDITFALEATRTPESIYSTVNNDSGNGNLLLIDKLSGGENGEETILNSVLLHDALDSLSSRERQILMLRYYKEKTQSEVAKIMGLSQVQISRIEKKLILRLRENIS